MSAHTSHELQIVAEVTKRRQAALAIQARREGGVYDRILDRWVEWGEDGPVAEETKGEQQVQSSFSPSTATRETTAGL